MRSRFATASPGTRLDQIRHYLADRYDLDREPNEAFVIVDEHLAGRSFRWAGHRAIWWIETDCLKVYGPSGHLETISGDPADTDRPATLPMFAPEEPKSRDTATRRRAA